MNLHVGKPKSELGLGLKTGVSTDLVRMIRVTSIGFCRTQQGDVKMSFRHNAQELKKPDVHR